MIQRQRNSLVEGSEDLDDVLHPNSRAELEPTFAEIANSHKIVRNRGKRFFSFPTFMKALGFSLMTTGKPFLDSPYFKKYLKQLKSNEARTVREFTRCYPDQLEGRSADDDNIRLLEKYLEPIPYIDLASIQKEVSQASKKIKFVTFQKNMEGEILVTQLGNLEGVDYLYIVVEKAGYADHTLLLYYEFVERPVRGEDGDPEDSLPNSIAYVMIALLLIGIFYSLLELFEPSFFPRNNILKDFNREIVTKISPYLPI